MTHPIENCPKPDMEVRDRAWTAERLENLASRMDAFPDDLPSVHDCIESSEAIRAYAATLRQQAERGGGEVSSEVVSKAWDVYLSCAEVGDQGMRAAIEAIAPLLRAPAEPSAQAIPTRAYVSGDMAVIVGTPQGDHDCDAMGCASFGPHVLCRIPVTMESAPGALAQNAQPKTLGDFVRLPDSERVAIGQQVVDRAIEMQNAQGEALTNEDAILKAIDLDPDSVAQQFAQNAQGDGQSVVFMSVTDDATPVLQPLEGWRDLPNGNYRLYTRAERARVPAGWVLVPREPTEEMLKAAFPYHHWCEPGIDFKRHWAKAIASAPSQPEDAA